MILRATRSNITNAAKTIRQGGIVAFPTETVYGLGANAHDASAVKKIFRAKDRPFFDPLIVHVDSLSSLEKMGITLDEKTRRLAKKFWPGPLTLIVKRPPSIPKIVTSGLDTMAVRIPDYPVARKLIQSAGIPIAAPSANPFGYLSPVTAKHVDQQLGKKVGIILDGGSCRVGVESTILDITTKIPTILRPGGITVEAIRKIEGKVHIKKSSSRPNAPGQLKSHYAPLIPLMLLPRNKVLDRLHLAEKRREAVGFLLIKPDSKRSDPLIPVLFLSRKGDMSEAAKNLFHHLHTLDTSGITAIYAEKPENKGMGHAVLDRLTRASRKRKS